MTPRTLADLMTCNIVTIDAGASLRDAAERMESMHISSLVATCDDLPCGILTERDLLRAINLNLPASDQVKDVMGQPLVRISADTPVLDAYHLLVGRNIRHLLVDDSAGKVIGIVSQSDFRFHLGADLLERLRDVRSIMTPRVPTLPPTANIADAARLMEHEQVTCCVVAEDSHPIGMITERDMVRFFRQGPGEMLRPLSDVMSFPVASLPADAVPQSAVARMRQQNLRHLVVVDPDGRIDGVLTEHDLVSHLDTLYVEQTLQARRDAEASLALSEARWSAVWEQSSEFFGLMAPQGMLLNCNPAAATLLGSGSAELVGRMLWETPWGAHDKTLQHRLRLAVERAGRGEPDAFETCHFESGQAKIHMDFHVQPIRDPQGRILMLLAQGKDITERVQAREALEHMAHYDPLTELPNRVLLADRLPRVLSRAERQGSLAAVCYLDLDGFKPVNDTYGHAAGDRLLIEVAERLKASVRKGDTAARLGGDEFVLLIGDLDSVADIDIAMERVFSAIRQPISIDGHTVNVSASIGIAVFPLDGKDGDVLLRNADQAMYSAKQAGRNRYHLVDARGRQRNQTHLELLAALGEALQRKEFELLYQPKVSLLSGRIIGVEALLRWRHPRRGLLAPMDFLTTLEESELALDVGRWVLTTAVAQADTWRRQRLDLGISINVSPQHVVHPAFVDELAQLLATHPDLPAEKIELEILESAALEDIERMAEVMNACGQLGVSFALDDFGTGKSSIGDFHHLPAQTLKIDRSFISKMLNDPRDVAVIESIIGLTSAFRRQVVAEGMETTEHGALLLQLGCELAQGYGIAKPMAADQVPDWIRSFNPHPSWAQPAQTFSQPCERNCWRFEMPNIKM